MKDELMQDELIKLFEVEELEKRYEMKYGSVKVSPSASEGIPTGHGYD